MCGGRCMNYHFARIRALQGRTDEAIAFLQRTVRTGWAQWYPSAPDPFLARLEGDPRYMRFWTSSGRSWIASESGSPPRGSEAEQRRATRVMSPYLQSRKPGHRGGFPVGVGARFTPKAERHGPCGRGLARQEHSRLHLHGRPPLGRCSRKPLVPTAPSRPPASGALFAGTVGPEDVSCGPIASANNSCEQRPNARRPRSRLDCRV